MGGCFPVGRGRNLGARSSADEFRGSSRSRFMTGRSTGRPTMSVSFPGESEEYRAARDRLLVREIELRRATEAVAAARRELPPGGAVPEDYVFQGAGADGAAADVRLS